MSIYNWESAIKILCGEGYVSPSQLIFPVLCNYCFSFKVSKNKIIFKKYFDLHKTNEKLLCHYDNEKIFTHSLR